MKPLADQLWLLMHMQEGEVSNSVCFSSIYRSLGHNIHGSGPHQHSSVLLVKSLSGAPRTAQGKNFEVILTVKISPVRGLTVDSSQLMFVPTSKSRETKTWPNIKNPARPQFAYYALV